MTVEPSPKVLAFNSPVFTFIALSKVDAAAVKVPPAACAPTTGPPAGIDTDAVNDAAAVDKLVQKVVISSKILPRKLSRALSLT